MKRKSFWVATGLLVFPVAFFFLLRASKQNYKHLPHLGEKIAPNGVDIKDTIFYQVPGGIDPATRLDARGSDY